MADVWEAVEAFAPWYSSVHRGSGFKSQVATEAFEARAATSRAFVGARADDDVVFVRNTTEAINVLAASLPRGHARALQPGRAPREHAPVAPPRREAAAVHALARRAAGRGRARAARRPIDLVAVTGASNVTGEVWPRRRARRARPPPRREAVRRRRPARAAPADRHGRAGSTCSRFSGHKLYAPFGAGALVGRLGAGEPLLHGGGAIKLVTLDDVIWADAPDRYEAGSPNVIGVVALARGLPARCARSAWTPSPSTSAGSPRGCGPAS